jgi:hypothetical protein
MFLFATPPDLLQALGDALFHAAIGRTVVAPARQRGRQALHIHDGVFELGRQTGQTGTIYRNYPILNN